MCGRITLSSSARELAGHFELDLQTPAPELHPRYNIAPSQEIVTVRQDRDRRRVLSLERWGLVPHWAKDPSIGNRMINARAETLADKPAFREAFRRRRCIVPADGFFEWTGLRGERTPYLFRRGDRSLLGIAGLYERWHGEGGEVVDSCTLITTEANATVRSFHDRMPVLLSPADYALWLDRDLQEPEPLLPLLVPCPDSWLEPSPVSTRINDPRNDDPDCLSAPPRTGNLFS
jgi:putative SOS response-associated peptidase YedK